MTFIRFENVGMRYGINPEILQDISFDLKQGSMNFLTGPSGAGKSSLLKLMYLAHRPSRGLVTLFGRDVTAATRAELPALRRRIGVVFQDFRLLDHLSAIDNVALPLRLAQGDKSEIMEYAEELLAWVGLEHRLEARPSTLSGGEQQRLAIARAVICRPDLLIADEPTGNLDADLSRRLMYLFVELNKIGTTTLIATHDRSLIENTVGTELRLEKGRLVDLTATRAATAPEAENDPTDSDHIAPYPEKPEEEDG